MYRVGYWRKEVKFESTLERIDSSTNGYVCYEVSVSVEIEPPGGDNINEPAYGPAAYVYECKVLSVFKDGNITAARAGDLLCLTREELGPIEEEALDKAFIENNRTGRNYYGYIHED